MISSVVPVGASVSLAEASITSRASVVLTNVPRAWLDGRIQGLGPPAAPGE